MNHQRSKERRQQRRAFRVRKRIRGTAQRPRLSVRRSHKHLYAQIIDDLQGKTLAAASTLEPTLRKELDYGGNCSAAQRVGQTIAQRATDAGITHLTFDRGRYRYHGRVAALADAVRKAGLQF